MKQFTSILNRINERLELPQPTKSRIILEIGADLQDLYQLYISRGMNEQEAFQKASEKYDLSDETLDDLIRIHQSPLKKLMDRITLQARTRWERVAFITTLLILVSITSQAFLSTEFFMQASKWIYPVLAISMITILVSIPKFYQFYIKKDHRIKEVRHGLSLVVGLSMINFAVGILGFLIELYAAGNNALLFVSHLAFISQAFDESSGHTLKEIISWMIKSSTLIMLTLMTTIFLAFVCYLLMNKVWKIEQAEASILLTN